MPVKIIADTRELLIDIYFAIIIAVGTENFVQHFILNDLFLKSTPTDLLKLSNSFLSEGILIDTLFFIATYFWVISHWVFYHDLMEKYPYYNWWKFFVDVALFSIMFLLINISYSVYTANTANKDHYTVNIAIASLFIVLLVVWYFLSCLWHLSDRKLRPVKRYLYPHVKRISTYTVLLALLYVPLPMIQINPVYQNVVLLNVIAAMIIWNIHRLMRFVKRDLREYKLLSISGTEFPSTKEGTLCLIKYPMRKKMGDMKNNITLKVDHNIISLSPALKVDHNIISLSPEKIEKITCLGEKEKDGDLMIGITYKMNSSIKRNILLNLDDRAIKGVIKGLNELRGHEEIGSKFMEFLDYYMN